MAVSQEIRETLILAPVDLPVFHPVALKLTLMLADPFADISDIIKAINDDQALAMQVLKMSNSSAYMGLVRVETIREAVIRLGGRQVSMLAMAASQASLHRSGNEVVNTVMRELWQHSIACAMGGWWVAVHTGQRNIADLAYLAGLLHDIGKLYLLKALEHVIAKGEKKIELNRQLLVDLFSDMHVEQGRRIMEFWNIAPVYSAVVEQHHAEHYDTVDTLLTITRFVNVISRKIGLSLNPEPFNKERIAVESGLLDLDWEQRRQLEEIMAGHSEVDM